MNWQKVGIGCLAGVAIAAFGLTLKATQEVPRSHAQSVGISPSQGPKGAAGSDVVGAPNVRTLSLATAYQATDPTRPAMVTINLTSTASITLTSGTTNTATVVIGSTNGVAGGTGTIMCNHGNSNTGSLSIGINLSTIATTSCTLALPADWWWAIRQTAGTVTITSSFDQSLGQ